MEKENLEITKEQKEEYALLKKNEKQLVAAELGLMLPKNITDTVLNSLETSMADGKLHIPKNYSMVNALKSAYLEIVGIKLSTNAGGGFALEKCTKSSIANALLTTVLNGLNPAKKQVYYIPYGTRLDAFISVFGKMAIAKRLPNATGEPVARLIYKGDNVEMSHNELGEEIITKHVLTFDGKMSGEIVGAYATMEINGIMRSAVMNITEIKESWSGIGSNKGTPHIKFTGEFAKRTILGRLLKPIIQSSDDSYLVMDGGTGGNFAKDNLVDDDTGEVKLTEEEKKEFEQAEKLQETTIKEGQFEEVAEPVKEEINVVIKDPKPEGEKEEEPVTRMKDGKQQTMNF
jgi:recombination protein RecT